MTDQEMRHSIVFGLKAEMQLPFMEAGAGVEPHVRAD
jgi:hypothetical protein